MSRLMTFEPSIFIHSMMLRCRYHEIKVGDSYDIPNTHLVLILILLFRANTLTCLPFAISIFWWDLRPALYNDLLTKWFNNNLLSLALSSTRSSSSCMGIFRKALLVGAKTVQGPAVNIGREWSLSPSPISWLTLYSSKLI